LNGIQVLFLDSDVMAKNKRDIDRQLKQTEIEEAAAELFVEYGYEATSMAMIAAHADVAPNTLYWYYKNKDEMLVAALNRLVAEFLTNIATIQDQPLDQQLLTVIEHFEEASKLVATVHARLTQSASIRDWHKQFHLMLDAVFIEKLNSRGLSATQAKMMATVGTFIIEGLLSNPHTKQQRPSVLAWLADLLSAKAP